MYGHSAYVGLASPGPVGSWQRENKVRSVKIQFRSSSFIAVTIELSLIVSLCQGLPILDESKQKGTFQDRKHPRR